MWHLAISYAQNEMQWYSHASAVDTITSQCLIHSTGKQRIHQQNSSSFCWFELWLCACSSSHTVRLLTQMYALYSKYCEDSKWHAKWTKLSTRVHVHVSSYKWMGQGLQDRVVVSHIHKQDCSGGWSGWWGTCSQSVCLHEPITEGMNVNMHYLSRALHTLTWW